MADNEIIKAFEKCASIGESCEGCPFYEYTDCDTRLKEEFHNLINRQKAEIERLQKYNTDVAFKHYNDGKSEGIKEFVERLKNKSEDCTGRGKPYVTFEDIDNLVKEMAGDNNG